MGHARLAPLLSFFLFLLTTASHHGISLDMDNGNREAEMDEIKCESCGAVHQYAYEVFEDIMGNERCTCCLPGLDEDEFAALDY